VRTAAPAIPGLTYVADYLNPEEQAELLTVIDRLPWSNDLKRRVQHYGYRYDYSRKTIDHDLYLGPLPDWAKALEERLRHDGHATLQLDQLIVNEYLPGQGIAPHIDCVPCFADTVLSLSLGSSCVLTMSQRDGGTKLPVLLEQGSLLVMAGEARYDWLHGIASRKSDKYEEYTFSRGRRVSLTFRTVLR
jgi:alkylated DNA repair dioxygenase AlkB